jgi:hypothetical protein
MSTFETDGNQWLSQLDELWQKLDTQIRQTHYNLEKLVEMKIRIEQELSRNRQDTACDQPQVTAQELEPFQAVRQEATRNFFRDGLEKLPLRMSGICRESEEVAHGW